MGSSYAGVDWASEKHDVLVADRRARSCWRPRSRMTSRAAVVVPGAHGVDHRLAVKRSRAVTRECLLPRVAPASARVRGHSRNRRRLSRKPNGLYEFDNGCLCRPRDSGSGGQSPSSAAEKAHRRIGILSQTHKKVRPAMVCAAASSLSGGVPTAGSETAPISQRQQHRRDCCNSIDATLKAWRLTSTSRARMCV